MEPKYRVLIIDESAFIRQYLTEILTNSGELEIVAATGDPTKARQLLNTREYDVITLDTGMNDGQAILNELKRANPKPVVLINAPAQNSEALAKAFTANVVDFITKPPFGFKEGMKKLNDEIVTKVTAAAKIKLAPKLKSSESRVKKTAPEVTLAGKTTKNELIVIGASTGGTVALTQIFRDLDIALPGIIIIQHMPAMFTEAFAQSLDQIGPIRVKEAQAGDRIYPGVALIVPGGKTLTIHHLKTELAVELHNPGKDTRYNPSIDGTMFTAATEVGANAMGIILTGMGDDGARGLQAMYDHGAYTIAQDEKSSIIYGMPKKAVEYGGVQKVLPLDELAGEMKRWAFSANGGKHESVNC
jgi:two-component system chemotaxis response regulator CheB